MPVYNTQRSGESHHPTFVSHVEVEGDLFFGQEAKTKKQAEMSAAKVAYMRLQERMLLYILLLSFVPQLYLKSFVFNSELLSFSNLSFYFKYGYGLQVNP